MCRTILVEYHGRLKQHIGNNFKVSLRQITSVNGCSRDITKPAPGDTVTVRSSKKSSRSGRVCYWEGRVISLATTGLDHEYGQALSSPPLSDDSQDASTSISTSPMPKRFAGDIDGPSDNSITMTTSSHKNKGQPGLACNALLFVNGPNIYVLSCT